MPEHPLLQKKFIFILIPVVLGIFLFAIYRATIPAPKDFPVNSIISVKEGTGLLKLSEDLEAEGVIRSSFLFRTAAILLKGERGMRAGDYYLSDRENVITITRRMVQGLHNIEIKRVTIPEGFTNKKISALFGDEYIFFDNEEFEAGAPEGYLFPDTYFLPITATASSTIKLLRDNFIRKIFPIMPEVELSERSLEDIIIMASILEGEAKTREDMEIISGILWKRIEIGMPLQVDTSFVGILGKGTDELTLDDLKTDSPYNTYTNTGLPPGPISNPGLDSIYAAIHPTTTPYLYFLTGDDGEMYYAKTFDEHVRNKNKYLR